VAHWLAAVLVSDGLLYPGAGHALAWEEPKRSASDPAAFIKNLVI
jgi:hypothetical protein